MFRTIAQRTILIFVFFFTTLSYAQHRPSISYGELVTNVELNPKIQIEAKELAANLNLPLSIYLPQGIFINALGIENEKPVYSLVSNLYHPNDNGQAIFFDEILNSYDLSGARIHYGDGRVENPTLGISNPTSNASKSAGSFLMITDFTGLRVMTFDVDNGDLINANFIPNDPANLLWPKEAQLSPLGKILISDQQKNGMVAYDTTGTFLSFFAPAGGVNISQLMNPRGFNFRENGNMVVCVGANANANSVAQFDPSGNYLGQFITTGSGGIANPFDIIFRANDALVSTGTAAGVYRFTKNGAPITILITGMSLAEQMQELQDKKIAVAEFNGSGSGIRLYDSVGTFIKVLNGVTQNRGVYQLRNGNFLTTNSTGVYEIDGSSGAIVRSLLVGIDPQFITLFDPSRIIPVELTSFNGEVDRNNISLSWSTASEKNNRGFAIERCLTQSRSQRDGAGDWKQIGFVEGKGTTTQTEHYTYVDRNLVEGTYYYRIKQMDFDGTFRYYSLSSEIEISFPKNFSLSQNYPNPFNPVTTIKFTVANQSIVKLELYNSLGELVSIIVNEVKAPGVYEIPFDASRLSSGFYLYKLTSEHGSFVKKMTLIK